MRNFILALFLISGTIAQPEIPELKYWVTDLTNTLSSQELNVLNNRLKTFEDSTSTQIAVLIIPALNDYPLEYYSYDVAKKNNIGTKEHDNGALLLVVKNDKKLRIEVGYGLEGALPDALSSSIIRNVIIPHFRRDDYFAGINSGIDAIISAVKGEYAADKKPTPDDEKTPNIIPILIVLFFIFNFLFRGRRRGRRGSGGFIFFPGGFGGGRSAGGFGGGGFGGFSGGGGSFGGGGASGSW